MHIAFVTTYDAKDPSLWAGTTYHMARALEAAGAKLTYIGPLREANKLYYKARQIVYRQLGRGALHRDREPAILDGYARQIEQRIAKLGADVIFSPGTVAIAHLKTTTPIVFWTDATYQALIDSYIWELPASKRSRRLGNEQEKRAIGKSALAIYSNDWAAQSAIKTYRADPAKVKVVPYGANVSESRTLDVIRRMIDARPSNRCRLLFVGTGWQRKGGDVAVEVARRMNAAGVVTELQILGADAPQQSELPEFARRVGFIKKKEPGGQERFDELFGGSAFLIHPARAEASAIVLCEAGSYGVPVLSTTAGGTPSIIRENINGLLTAPDDPAAMTARALELFQNREAYKRLALSSFAEYKSRLNWSVSVNEVMAMLRKLTSR